MDDDLTEEQLAELAEEGTDEEKRAVAKHHNANLETLLSLCYEGFVDDVDQNPLLPLHIEVGSENAVKILTQIAEQTEREERLEELASSVWMKVRQGVASNRFTPTQCLAILANDPAGNVRYGVAHNESTLAETLNLLATDVDENVRSCVAGNEGTLSDTLTLLCKDHYWAVRSNVAKNFHTLPDVLVILSKDVEKPVLRGVAENEHTPPDVLSNLTKENSQYVREAARATLEKLKNAPR